MAPQIKVLVSKAWWPEFHPGVCVKMEGKKLTVKVVLCLPHTAAVHASTRWTHIHSNSGINSKVLRLSQLHRLHRVRNHWSSRLLPLSLCPFWRSIWNELTFVLPICLHCEFPFWKVFYEFLMNFIQYIFIIFTQLLPLTPPRSTPPLPPTSCPFSPSFSLPYTLSFSRSLSLSLFLFL